MLRIERVSKSFEGLVAVREVTLEVHPGEVLGLIGPNGSGKSTLLNLATGALRPDSGEVFLDGRAVDLRRPDLAARRGICRTFQVPRVVRRMTVLQNLMVGPREQPAESLLGALIPSARARDVERGVRERAWQMLALLDLQHRANDWAANLSGGQLKLLSVGIALMADPRVLLLDEPAAGVNVRIIERLLPVIRRLRDEQRIVVIVEHNMDLIQSVSDRVAVMSAGMLIFDGDPHRVAKQPQVVEAYLGLEAART